MTLKPFDPTEHGVNIPPFNTAEYIPLISELYIERNKTDTRHIIAAVWYKDGQRYAMHIESKNLEKGLGIVTKAVQCSTTKSQKELS